MMNYMKSKITLILILLFVLTNFKIGFAENNITNLSNKLTDEEKEFLAKNKEFTYALMSDYFPIEFIDSKNNPRGFGVEYLKKASELLGVEFKLVEDYKNLTWSDCLNKLRKGEIDLLPSMNKTEERKEFVEFTQIYYDARIIVVGNNYDEVINSTDQLNAYKLALVKDYWLNDKLSSLNTENFINKDNIDNIDTVLKNVNNFKADYALLENIVFDYYGQKTKYKNLRIVGELDLDAEVRIGVSKNKKILASILNKVIDSVPKEDIFSNVIKEDKKIHTSYYNFAIFTLALVSLIVIKNLYTKLLNYKKIQKEFNKNKETFIENLSHDLKTPLSSLKVNVDLLKHGLINESDKNQHYKKMDKNLYTLNEIIDELNEITKLKDTISSRNFEYVEISSFLQDIYDQNINAFLSEDKLLELIHDEKNMFNKIRIEPFSFSRAINNLLCNSLKFTKGGGITKITYLINENDIHISVKDNGIGISKKDLNNIFERFYKVSKSRNTTEKGKGLGLAITKDIVELHNGSISVESELGKGTTFKIIIPI